MKKYLFLILVCLLSGCKEEMTENSLCEKIGKELNRALPFRTSIMHSENTGSGQCTFWTKSNKNQKFFYDALFFDDWGVLINESDRSYISIKPGKEKYTISAFKDFDQINKIKKIKLRKEEEFIKNFAKQIKEKFNAEPCFPINVEDQDPLSRYNQEYKEGCVFSDTFEIVRSFDKDLFLVRSFLGDFADYIPSWREETKEEKEERKKREEKQRSLFVLKIPQSDIPCKNDSSLHTVICNSVYKVIVEGEYPTIELLDARE